MTTGEVWSLSGINKDSGIKANNAGPLGNARSQSIVRAKGVRDLVGKLREKEQRQHPVLPTGVCFDLLFFSVFGLCSHLPPQPTDSSPKRPPATCILHATSLLPCGSCVSLVSRSRVQLTAKSAQWLWRQEIVPTRFGWDRVFRPLLYTRSQSIGVHQGRFPGAALALHDAETASCPICVAGHSSATSPKHPVIQTPKTCFPILEFVSELDPLPSHFNQSSTMAPKFLQKIPRVEQVPVTDRISSSSLHSVNEREPLLRVNHATIGSRCRFWAADPASW